MSELGIVDSFYPGFKGKPGQESESPWRTPKTTTYEAIGVKLVVSGMWNVAEESCG